MSSIFGGDIFPSRYIQHLHKVPTSWFGRFSSKFNSASRNFSNQKYFYVLMLSKVRFLKIKNNSRFIIFKSFTLLQKNLGFVFEGKETKIVMMIFAYYSNCYFLFLNIKWSPHERVTESSKINGRHTRMRSVLPLSICALFYPLALALCFTPQRLRSVLPLSVCSLFYPSALALCFTPQRLRSVLPLSACALF
jgi:hypothetical protein